LLEILIMDNVVDDIDVDDIDVDVDWMILMLIG